MAYIKMTIAPGTQPIVRDGELPRWARALEVLLRNKKPPATFYKADAVALIWGYLNCSTKQAVGAYEYLLDAGYIQRAEYH